jgi:hypothetical protein
MERFMSSQKASREAKRVNGESHKQHRTNNNGPRDHMMRVPVYGSLSLFLRTPAFVSRRQSA